MNKFLTLLAFIAFSLVSANNDDLIKAFHIDCGRKYFKVEEIKDQIDLLAEKKYNTIELAIGNEGLRFLLDNMELEVLDVTYPSDQVKKAINDGNKHYHDAGPKNEWTEKEMDELISYANSKGIQVIPLINTPGHMDAILFAEEKLTNKKLAYGGSSTTIDISNPTAISFTQELLFKYIEYFSKKGIKYINLGCDEYANDKFPSGFAELIKQGKYGYLIKYINEIADLVFFKGMKAIIFNDPIYYNNVMEAECEGVMYTINTKIIASLWTAGWGGYDIAKASVVASKGIKLLNTNGGWYYVLGKELKEDNLRNIKWDQVIGEGKMDVIGSMICTWCDQPGVVYEGREVENVHKQISIFSESNPDIFKTDKEIKFLF